MPACYRTGGPRCLLQDGRTARLGPGEFTLYDFTRPYELAYDSGVQLAVFSFPREMLALPGDLVGRLTAVPVRTDTGTGALTAPLLRRVALDMDGYQPASAARLSAVVMNLITTAVAEHAGQTGSLPAESRENTLLMRVHAFIEQHLGDCDLAPGPIAAAHYISVRYLYRLFEAQGTTVAAWIRHRRLERCRADLGDPALSGAPVSAVAARWGLPDSAHFNRLFKRTSGLPPAEYLDQAPAPGTLPRGPGRPGPGQRAGERRRGALGPAGLGSLQPVVQAHLRVAAGRIPAGIPDARQLTPGGLAGNVNRLAARGNTAGARAEQTGAVRGRPRRGSVTF